MRLIILECERFEQGCLDAPAAASQNLESSNAWQKILSVLDFLNDTDSSSASGELRLSKMHSTSSKHCKGSSLLMFVECDQKRAGGSDAATESSHDVGRVFLKMLKICQDSSSAAERVQLNDGNFDSPSTLPFLERTMFELGRRKYGSSQEMQAGLELG